MKGIGHSEQLSLKLQDILKAETDLRKVVEHVEAEGMGFYQSPWSSFLILLIITHSQGKYT